jgi:hypothetical protein
MIFMMIAMVVSTFVMIMNIDVNSQNNNNVTTRAPISYEISVLSTIVKLIAPENLT